MTLKQYFSELQQKLKHLSAVECEEALVFYAEYASEANIQTYEDMAKRFGVPRELAAAIYAETAARELDKPTGRSLLRGVWIGLAALAAFPFSLSALAVICSLGVALVVSAGSMLLSLLLSAAAIAAYGVWSLVHSFAFLSPFSPGSFLISLGRFFLLTPLGLALLALFLCTAKKLLAALTEKIAATIQRRTTHEA